MNRAFQRKPLWLVVWIACWLGFLGGQRIFAAPLQAETDVSPEATPQIQQVKPNHAAPGEEITVVVEGRNFSPGAYVSFANPGVHVASTRRVSATQLETNLVVNAKTQTGTISLYVSNPASVVAEAPFTISAAQGPPPPAPTPEIQPSEAGTPQVTAVDPARVAPGSQATLKVTGKNFAKSAKVSFSNPGIRVLETNVSQSTELTSRIQVAADAPTGRTSLFVVNPGDREVEAPFEVAGGTPTTPAAPAKGTTETTPAAATSFEVYNLGDVVNILQHPNKPKGTLSVAGGKLSYSEGGKEVFSTALGHIKEINVNTLFGMNTGTFHLILNSGKTYNFVAASLRPQDTQAIIDSLRRALN